MQVDPAPAPAPRPYILNPKPYTLNPKPYTLAPTPPRPGASALGTQNEGQGDSLVPPYTRGSLFQYLSRCMLTTGLTRFDRTWFQRLKL